MIVSAQFAPLLMIFFGVPAGICIAILGCECGSKLRHTNWRWLKRH